MDDPACVGNFVERKALYDNLDVLLSDYQAACHSLEVLIHESLTDLSERAVQLDRMLRKWQEVETLVDPNLSEKANSRTDREKAAIDRRTRERVEQLLAAGDSSESLAVQSNPDGTFLVSMSAAVATFLKYEMHENRELGASTCPTSWPWTRDDPDSLTEK